MINQPAPARLPDDAVNAVRSSILFTSIVGIVAGILMMVWPGVTVLLAGLFFGIAMVVAGLFRLFAGFAMIGLSAGLRLLAVVLGVLMVALGVLAIISPEDAWWMIAVFIGVGWIFSGFQDLFGASVQTYLAPRWLVMVGGIISILAGIVMLIFSPADTLTTIAWVVGLLLIVVSVTQLFLLPPKSAA
ncbi:HdeD family acid-resistance protein [Gordonia sp. VNK21]|uniref:HdeD family acid-resistance protein n=1 Tax=Gordonia sp. VNK21 TaxID=3382483 RepID=UPI0038D3A219